ncbi:RNA polymerase sigma factor [Kibdelosporangium persicum]|uniref:RNA polymerase sigma factor n=1 Tax=Kibdelosporangium persicum TaxID=2698649 RepID=UPI001566C034|nr:sigma-70 family RNA polymerase sigma factor [Kibdelosporangium persicum]
MLIESVRLGDTSAYELLYKRHKSAAYSVARCISCSTSEADDLVAEGFARVLATLVRGEGPRRHKFRAYLLTTIRHVAYDRTRKDRRLTLCDDIVAATDAAEAAPFEDPLTTQFENSTAAQAFDKLPPMSKDTVVLTIVLGLSPSEAAVLLGVSPNCVSARMYRARQELRAAYVQAQVPPSVDFAKNCRFTMARLGAWLAQGPRPPSWTPLVEAHLSSCRRCARLAAELTEINDWLSKPRFARTPADSTRQREVS